MAYNLEDLAWSTSSEYMSFPVLHLESEWFWTVCRNKSCVLCWFWTGLSNLYNVLTCFFFQPIKSKAKTNTWLGSGAFSRLDNSCVAYSTSPDWSIMFFTVLIVFCVISRPKQRSEPPCCGLSLNRERKRFWKELIKRGKTSWKRFEKLKIKMFYFSQESLVNSCLKVDNSYLEVVNHTVLKNFLLKRTDMILRLSLLFTRKIKDKILIKGT